MGISQNFWVNFTGFQLIWWLSILYGNSAALPVTILILLHLLLHTQPLIELFTLILTSLLGFSIDFLLTLNGVFIFTESEAVPLWLGLLWLGFCATLRNSLSFFSGRYLLSAFVGSVGGSTTYLAAATLGAVELGFSPITVFIILLLIWAGLFPLLIFLSHRIGVRYALRPH